MWSEVEPRLTEAMRPISLVLTKEEPCVVFFFLQHPRMEISVGPSAALQSLPTLLLLSDHLLPACQELRRGAVKTFSPSL